jgi:biopolymer transport protein ExbD
VTITANPGVEYKTVIDVMDSLRNDNEEELFPEVHFGAAR